jgi:large subunit ribosomal protein L25
MDTTIEVSPRQVGGKGVNRKARARGVVPAVVYGREVAPRAVELDPEKLLDLFKETKNRNTVVSLKVGGDAPFPCLVREVQRHPLSRAIVHVDFYAVPQEAIEVMIPLRPVGRPKGAVLGGRLQLIRREVRVAARFDKIPEAIEIDATPLDVGDTIMASQLNLPEGVSLVLDNDFLVVRIMGKRTDVAEEAKPAAPAEEKKE